MRACAAAALLCAAGAAPAAAAGLTPHAYKPLPVGSVTPKGWLLKQLKLQADGLTGHLAHFWNDVMNSVWIGGGGDGGLHERTPYWLNGIVPLAFLLRNADVKLDPVTGIYKRPWGVNASADICSYGTDMRNQDLTSYNVASEQECYDGCKARSDCYGFVVDNCTSPMTCWLKAGNGAVSTADCRCYGKNIPTPKPVDTMAQVEQYVSHILGHQNADGWLGPEGSGGGQYWGPSNAMQALYQYAEGSGDPTKFKNASQAVLRHLVEQKRRMATAAMSSWAAVRWLDMANTAEWVLDNADVGPHKQDLMDLIQMLHDQGGEWDEWFETGKGNGHGGNLGHNVNIAQGLKSSAVYYRYNSSATHNGLTMPELSKRRMANMDARYGLPTGMFNGDEIVPPAYPDPQGRSPSRGIETCGVVEAMFSYNTMFSVHGDPAFADRAERIAYNALPATWASPTGGDMWAHQYLQAVNEINAIKADPHVWTHDGDMSETYGLEPNYGCCTANFNQGWPKYANMLMYSAPDGGAVVGLWAPASAKLPGGVTVDVDTEYPFGDTAKVTVTASKATAVYLRIPAWATRATVNGAAAANGTMWKGSAAAGSTAFTVAFNPEVRLEEWDNGARSVHRGVLLYSLPITPNYTVYAHHYGTDTQSNDYYLEPQSPWQYALDVDPSNPQGSLTFSSSGYKAGAAPFNHSGWPTMITATVRELPSWGTAVNSAAIPPASPACKAHPSSPYQTDVDLYGGDVAPCGSNGCTMAAGATYLDCETKCNATAACVAYVFAPADCNGGTALCWTKGPDHAPASAGTCRNSRVMGGAGGGGCGASRKVALVPHGGTELRIGEWPVADY